MERSPLVIPGFTTNFVARDKPSMLIFGPTGAGKTRLACTMAEIGPIGFIALDKKTRRTAEKLRDENGWEIHMPQTDYIDDNAGKQIFDMNLMPEAGKDKKESSEMKQAKYDKAKAIYKEVLAKVMADLRLLLNVKGLEGIVLDKGNQLMDFMLFAQFGRTEKILPTARGGIKADFAEIINLVQDKRLCIVTDASEIYVPMLNASGQLQYDDQGEVKRTGSGKFQSALKDAYSLVTVTLELRTNQNIVIMKEDDDKKLGEKYKAMMYKCQTDQQWEGREVVKGADITWMNVMSLVGAE